MSSWMMTVFPTPAPPKTPIFPPFGERADEVDDLDPGFEDLGLGDLLVESGSRSMDRQHLGLAYGPLLVDRLAQDVEDPAQGHLPDGHRDGPARVRGFRPARQAVGRGHGHAANPVVAQVLLDLANDLHAVASGYVDGVVDGGQLARGKLDVDDRAGDLDDAAVGRAAVGRAAGGSAAGGRASLGRAAGRGMCGGRHGRLLPNAPVRRTRSRSTLW